MKTIRFAWVAPGGLPKRWVVYEDGTQIGAYFTLDEAIASDPISEPYCPVCFLNAPDCTDKQDHMEKWSWS